MTRAYNFCAGPAAIPEPVLQKAKEELLNWGSVGASIMEMSHRSETFLQIASEAEQDLRNLMHIPDNYHVLFLQGGASTQFAVIPMNLLRGKKKADYVRTGIWSHKAVDQAEAYCEVNLVTDTMDKGYNYIPDVASWNLDPEAAYFHYTPNETIGGVEFNFIPDTGDVPIVADMSSNILSRPINVSKYGLIYAGAQKNIGPSGITLVIVRDDLIGDTLDITPEPFNYYIQARDASLYNTPPTFAWYLTGLVFKWLKEQGGPEAMVEINERKAKKLYAAIDKTDFYHNDVKEDCRSWMNVPFQLQQKNLDTNFVTEAEENNLLNLNGWRTVGGMRASIYNAVPEEAVDALVAFMSEFERRYG
ncbi:MAG TPA: 3-phosphoserine/phosphohydroxythreonine transaminase [Thiotrichaceae bacterium]|jgi:phosphoserine aminotransferase|nr:3-phosphoserine/phosphohydroxythreonine transaminase [Thiotrichaceae bacterium]HIM08664.1 3-phosphoserine/phosphohydroxythreonine transaminase [Gammaproteobacteria bacterium]